MVPVRVMPCLLLKGQGLVKTVRFKDPTYVGDPRNAVRIFNEKEVDELVILDILATPQGRRPRFDLIEEIVSEAFMPVAYGGGIRDIEDAARVLALGVEKVVLCTRAVEDPPFLSEAAERFGSQSVVACLDVKKRLFGGYEVYTRGGRKGCGRDPLTVARQMEKMGAGEILLQSIDRDGTQSGYDLELIRQVAGAVSIPVVAAGGASRMEDFRAAVLDAGASAVAAGSLFVFKGKHRAVLITYPEPAELETLFSE